jgi:hypothetical protein
LVVPSSPNLFHQLAGPGIRSVKKNWPAILALQVAGAIVVVSYFRVPAMEPVCDQLARWKAAGGFAFSAVSMALICGLLPEVAKFVTGVDRTLTRERRNRTLLNLLVYTLIGMQCDALYRVVAYAYGDQLTVGTVAAKVATDQFLFTPLISLPTMALLYTWRDAGYRAAAMGPLFRRRWYLTRVAPMLLPCWAYWIPMASLMYALPAKLTFVYNACAAAASAIMLTAVAGRDTEVLGDTPGDSQTAEPVPSTLAD